jgi:deoxycytidylate deaminase
MSFKQIKGVEAVFIDGNEIIITGCPADSEDEAHNCDEMGCNSVEHILLRGQLRFCEKGYNEALQEAAQAGEGGQDG